jgi:hypothetical protein
MKASIVRIAVSLGLCAALGLISLEAQMPGPIHVTVPFDFTVGSKSLAAGQYNVRQQAPHVLAIQSVDGRSAMVIMTHAGEPNAAPGTALFKFNKYGDRYFLSQVSDSSRGWELPKSPVEKELIAKKASPKPVIVPAGGDQ